MKIPPQTQGLGPDDLDDEDDFLDAPVAPAGNEKLQRYVDLLAALLAHQLPQPFTELAKSVPAYAADLRAAEREGDPDRASTLMQSLKRKFERDKDDLRALGVPIESLPDEDGNAGGAYRLKNSSFYLPYLCVAAPGEPATSPRKVAKYGYQALATLTFDADELQAIVDAAATVRSLGDPLLAADVDSALRKLAVDLPLDAAVPSNGEPHVVLPRTRPDAAVFDALSDALLRRKAVSFTYHAMSSDRTEAREVEPYGLFFLSGHWYLAARDRGRGDLRNFRLNRASRVKVNGQKPAEPDYTIPETFRLRDHARMRQVWELGDGDAEEAVVEFRGQSGPTMAAMQLGEPVEGEPTRRRFAVRRPDAFVRWLLSFAGEVVPMAPAALVERFQDEVRKTLAVYDAEPRDVRQASTTSPSKRAHPPRTDEEVQRWQPKTAAAQLRRILLMVPQIADGEEHSLREVAERVGTDPDTLRRDVYSLVSRFDTPAGFVEGVQLYVEPDRISARTNHLLRPMRLTVSELCALELGLAVLRQRRPPDEHRLLDGARERLRKVIAQLPAELVPDALREIWIGEPGRMEHFVAVRHAVQRSRKLRLAYRKSGASGDSERVICPHAIVAASGMLYVIAQCEAAEGIRVFRMDRVVGAELLEEGFERVDGFSLDDVLKEGRVFQSDEHETLRVRYSPRVARWIAERERRTLDADGGLVVEHPLADPEWGVRHVLQYGPDAEVVGPEGMRGRVRGRLGEMARG